MAQTDNSYLADKVMLRVNHLPGKSSIKVLDCYGGYGTVWRWVKILTELDIDVLPIDTRDVGFALPGDNRAYLGTIDLSRFDVIDLDAYGVPFEQLQTVMDRGFEGVIFVTFIQSMYGQLPSKMIDCLGYPAACKDKCPTLLSRGGWDKMLQYLATRGINKISHRSHGGKHYFVINGAEAREVDSHIREEGTAANPS